MPDRGLGAVGDVVAAAGEALRRGEELPVAPRSTPALSGTGFSDATGYPAGAFQAYASGGWTYDDAVALARLWDAQSTVEAKAIAGARLQAGLDVPLAPGSAAPDPHYPRATDADPIPKLAR